MSTQIDRRRFLQAGAAAGLGLGVTGAARAESPKSARIQRTVTLGRTGLRVSDIGFGGSRLGADEGYLVQHALDRGVTYFDTAASYTGGDSELAMAKVLKPVRDKVVLVSKVKMGESDGWRDIMANLDGSLGRLETDYVDVYFNHAVNDVDRVKNPGWGEFVERAKQAGKIRFSGMSGHGGRLVESIDAALELDIVDVLLVGYNFGQDPAFLQRFTASFDFVAVQPGLPDVLQRAKSKNVGVVAMKTLRGGRLNDLRPYEEGDATFAQAAFRWTLASPRVDSLIVTMKSTEMIDEYLVASGWRARGVQDARLLDRYEELHAESQCRYGCDACSDSCPAGVEIPDVLRTRMYAEDYGDVTLARGDYAGIAADASACLACVAQSCTCPFGLDISGLTRRTHEMLG